MDAPFPIAAAARSGKTILVPDLHAYEVEFPEILLDTVAAGVQATASIPLHRADGTLVGVIGFAWTEPTSFDARLESALKAIADLCTATIERAERYARNITHRGVASRLLGDLPALPGIADVGRYLPASRRIRFGGDWYEGLLDGQRIALVVGDVTATVLLPRPIWR